MPPVIYADLRCLQDKDYQRRGIGYHCAELLRARRNSAFRDWKCVGVLDASMPDIPADLLDVADETTACVNPCLDDSSAVFIDPSPMTHDSRFSLRFQSHPSVLKAAVLYDFIPLDWPGYLPTVTARISYLARLTALKRFERFFPISFYTFTRLRELLNVPEGNAEVTGACVRESLYGAARAPLVDRPRPYEEPYFVTLGGDDRRKNTDAAILAVQRLNRLSGTNIPLKIIGFYCDAYKEDLLKLAEHEEGNGFVEFYSRVPDNEVVRLHAGAIAAICPSRIEGFSLPVPEAAVCGCPAIASTCAAHMELVTEREALFDTEDHVELGSKLEAVLRNPALREHLVKAQAHLARDFRAAAVGERFWNSLEGARPQLQDLQRKRSRLAFLSAHPPDAYPASGYTAELLRGMKRDADLYSDSPRPLVYGDRFRDAARVSAAPLLDSGYSGIVSVLGSGAASEALILDFVERYGGPCLLHSLRLLPAQVERMGMDRFCELAGKAHGRAVTPREVRKAIEQPEAGALFLHTIVRTAKPLLVQTPAQAALLEKQYGVRARAMMCCPKLAFATSELTSASKREMRRRLGIPPDAFAIANFGEIREARPMHISILATELLRSWNIPAQLYFVGAPQAPKQEIARVAGLFDIADSVHVRDESKREFLIAADAALQLRDYAFGEEPGELVDCIAAGLPSVGTEDMALAAEAPVYVRTVPDRFSPLQAAEQLAPFWELPIGRDAIETARAGYCETHNFERYSARLREHLGL